MSNKPMGNKTMMGLMAGGAFACVAAGLSLSGQNPDACRVDGDGAIIFMKDGEDYGKAGNAVRLTKGDTHCATSDGSLFVRRLEI